MEVDCMVFLHQSSNRAVAVDARLTCCRCVAAFSIALAATGMLSACSKTGSTPTLGPTSLVPVGTVIEIAGPDIVPLGASVQFRLIAHLPNGSQRDVTNE